MINTLLTMALTGSAVVLVWLMVDRLAGKRISPVWHERILRLALFFMLVPVGRLWETASKLLALCFVSGTASAAPGTLPLAPAVSPDAVIAVLPGALPEVTVVPPAAPSAPVTVSADLFALLTVVWALGAAAALLRKLWAYRRFKCLLRGKRRPLSDEGMEVFHACKAELGVKGSVEVFVMDALPTPMVVGLLRPAILLPEAEMPAFALAAWSRRGCRQSVFVC